MPEIVSVIEFAGPLDNIVWKSPVQNFNSASQLVVDEGHWAILLSEGRAELFGPGRHTLDTSNYPVLRGIQGFATGGKTMFPCQVYYVKQVHSMDLRWGSQDLITVNDPQLDIIMHLRIRGNLTYTIENPIQFVEKFSGFSPSFTPDDTVGKFRGIISTEVSDCITRIVNVAQVGYLDINAHLKEISQILQQQLTPFFDSYGIRLVYFLVETITSREDDLVEVQRAKSAARALVIDATGQAQAREIQGFTWSEERKAQILETLAGNQGSIGGMMGLGVGMMSAGSMGASLNAVATDIFGPQQAQGASAVQQMGQQVAPGPLGAAGAPQRFGFTSQANPAPVTPQVSVEPPHQVDVRDAFAQQGTQPVDPTQLAPTQPLGQPAPQPAPSQAPAAVQAPTPLSLDQVKQKLGELQELLALGLITQDDFDEQKRELLARLTA